MMKRTKLILLLSLFLFNSCDLISQKKSTSKNPRASKIYTSDIDNFYRAFDLAIIDTLHANRIFKSEYFSKGTKGLRDFYKSKIRDRDRFTKFVLKHQDFYSSIKQNMLKVNVVKEQVYTNFENFKKIYPEAVFPDIYFVIGRFSSNGTISKRGLLIGAEILSRTEQTNTKKWNKNILRLSMQTSHIPITISHELIHFNQGEMKEDNTLLAYSIGEGSAEFIAELISGETDGNYEDFVGKEEEILNDFEQEKGKDIWSSWHKKSEKRPRNAGYWVGYIICKAYYHQVKDKEKAVHDILNIKDYQEFYEKSKVRDYLFNKE